MITSGDQNQFASFFAPFGDLLKTLMFLSNLNGFDSSPLPPGQGFAKQKGSSKVWKEKGSKWFSHFFSLFPFCLCTTCLSCFLFLSQSSFMLCVFLFHVFVLVVFNFALFVFHKNKNKNKNKLKNQKNTKIVCVCVYWYLCTLDGHWSKVF